MTGAERGNYQEKKAEQSAMGLDCGRIQSGAALCWGGGGGHPELTFKTAESLVAAWLQMLSLPLLLDCFLVTNCTDTSTCAVQWHGTGVPSLVLSTHLAPRCLELYNNICLICASLTLLFPRSEIITVFFSFFLSITKGKAEWTG